MLQTNRLQQTCARPATARARGECQEIMICPYKMDVMLAIITVVLHTLLDHKNIDKCSGNSCCCQSTSGNAEKVSQAFTVIQMEMNGVVFVFIRNA